jgi:Skp family chaperone for outer membrane proteins
MRALWVAAVLVLAPAPALALDVGVVDMERAMQATKHFQQAKAKLEKEQSKRQALLDQKQADLQKEQDALEAQKAVATAESLLPQEQKLMMKARALGQQFQALQQELTQLEMFYTRQMLERFQAIVNQLAVDRDLDYVFHAGNEAEPNVLFSKPAIDYTDEVVEKYRESYADKPLYDPETK